MTLKEELEQERLICIDELLNENISYTVDSVASAAVKLIMDRLDKTPWFKETIRGTIGNYVDVYVKHITESTLVLNQYTIISCIVYKVDRGDIGKLYDMTDLSSSHTYLQHENIHQILIKSVTTNDAINKNKIESAISHELLHMYQKLNQLNNKTYIPSESDIRRTEIENKIYNIANDNVRTPLGYAIYLLDKGEIMAHMQELTNALFTTNPCSFDELPKYEAYAKYQKLFEEILPILDNMNENEWKEESKKYGVSVSYLRNYIKTRKQYAIKKIHQTLKHYHTVYGTCDNARRRNGEYFEM